MMCRETPFENDSLEEEHIHSDKIYLVLRNYNEEKHRDSHRIYFLLLNYD